jgi:site-specific recombinase XerD
MFALARKASLDIVTSETSPASLSPQTVNTIRQLLLSYQRDGMMQNLKATSLRKRHRMIAACFVWLEMEGRLTTLDAIGSQDVAAYLAHQRERGLKPSTIHHCYLVLHAWFTWLEREGDIPASPMRTLKAPKLVVSPPPVLPDDAVKALLAACDGNSFRDRRDNAILRTLLDTGLRASELLAIELDHLDWQHRTVAIPDGKGGYRRVVRFGLKTSRALDRYMRVRAQQKHADEPWLWITQRGHMCYMSLWRIVSGRGEQAGLGHTWPHLMRHEFAHLWLRDGGQERSLLQLGGWHSSAMLARYGASAAQQRALADHDQFAPGDKF